MSIDELKAAGICKDCIHYHDDIKELPVWQRIFTSRTMFSATCDHQKFLDPVDGTRYPCVTARINKCQGLKPFFEPKNAII